MLSVAKDLLIRGRLRVWREILRYAQDDGSSFMYAFSSNELTYLDNYDFDNNLIISFSEITATPSSRALSSLEPGSSAATT